MSKTTSAFVAYFVASAAYVSALDKLVSAVQADGIESREQLRPIAMTAAAKHYKIALVDIATGPYAGQKGLDSSHASYDAARQAISRAMKACFPEGNDKVDADPVAKIVKAIAKLDGRTRRSLWKQLRDAGITIA